MDVNGTNLSMVRGDSERIIVRGGQGITLSSGSEIRMKVRRPGFSSCVIDKTVTSFSNNEAIINIMPADTSGLKFGKYEYDIQLKEANGNVTTVVRLSTFTILKEVTYE